MAWGRIVNHGWAGHPIFSPESGESGSHHSRFQFNRHSRIVDITMSSRPLVLFAAHRSHAPCLFALGPQSDIRSTHSIWLMSTIICFLKCKLTVSTRRNPLEPLGTLAWQARKNNYDDWHSCPVCSNQAPRRGQRFDLFSTAISFVNWYKISESHHESSSNKPLWASLP